MHISKQKLSKFWRLFQQACADNLPRTATTADKDAYRHRIIEEATGQPSLRDVNPSDFERLMQRLSAETDDHHARLYWHTCTERRYVYLIGAQLTQISCITGEGHPWQYAKGILKQAHWPDDFNDITADMQRSVFQMLDTHRRRLLRRAGWRGAKFSQPLNFNNRRTYYYDNGVLVYRDDIPIDSVHTQEVLCSR